MGPLDHCGRSHDRSSHRVCGRHRKPTTNRETLATHKQARTIHHCRSTAVGPKPSDTPSKRLCDGSTHQRLARENHWYSWNWSKSRRAGRREAQACVNVLCAYLRLPYEKPPTPGATDSTITAQRSDGSQIEIRTEYRHDDDEVRSSIVAMIARNTPSVLRLNPIRIAYQFIYRLFALVHGGDSGTRPWTVVVGPSGWGRLSYDFNSVRFSGPVFFNSSYFAGPISFANAKFNSTATFFNARFKRRVSFSHAEFRARGLHAGVRPSGCRFQPNCVPAKRVFSWRQIPKLCSIW